MADLRELLQQAAGDPAPPPPLADIRLRGKTLARRRRLVTLLAVTVALVALAALSVVVATFAPAPRTPATPPSPAPVVSPGALTATTYTDPSLRPGVTFTVPDGPVWRATLVTADSLILANDALQTTISLQRWTSIYQPQTNGTTTPTTAARPTDLISWLSRHPALRPHGGPQATLLGRRPAHRLTVTVNPRRTLPTGPVIGCTAAPDCVLLADTPDNPVVIYPNTTTIIYALDHDQDSLILIIAAATGKLTPTIPIADSLRFR
jgi:hypothetical protein